MRVVVTNESGHLMIQPRGQPKREAVPLSETEFMVREAGATLKFTSGEMSLTQGGQTMTGKRVQ
jgi:hypothetical protein